MEQWRSSETGTPQGAVVSPMLSNIYLHYAFDLWAERGDATRPAATSSWCAMGARCANRARPGLCGGRPVTGVPTAIAKPIQPRPGAPRTH